MLTQGKNSTNISCSFSYWTLACYVLGTGLRYLMDKGDMTLISWSLHIGKTDTDKCLWVWWAKGMSWVNGWMDKFGFDCVCTFGINIMCPSLRSPRISEIKQGGAIEDHPRMLSHTLAMLRLQWPLFSSRNSHVPPTTGPLCPVSMAWEGPPTSFQLIHSYSSFRGTGAHVHYKTCHHFLAYLSSLLKCE